MEMSDADFNDFLDNAAREVEQKELAKQQTRMLMRACDDALDHYGVPTTYRFDPSRRAEQERIQGYRPSSGSIMNEDFFVTRTAMLAIWKPDHGTPLSMVTELKKQLMAAIHVELGASPDSPWMKFVDGFAKGEALDFDSLEDMTYLINAQKAWEQKIRDRKKQSVLYSVIAELIDEDADEETFMKYFMLSIDLHDIFYLNEYEKGARIDEAARSYGIPQEHVIKLVATLETYRQNREDR